MWRLNDGPSLACVSPAFDVAFYSSNTLLLATQICFGCKKLTSPDTDGFGSIPFDAKGPTGRALLKAIQDSLRAGRYYSNSIQPLGIGLDASQASRVSSPRLIEALFVTSNGRGFLMAPRAK